MLKSLFSNNDTKINLSNDCRMFYHFYHANSLSYENLQLHKNRKTCTYAATDHMIKSPFTIMTQKLINQMFVGVFFLFSKNVHTGKHTKTCKWSLICVRVYKVQLYGMK